MIAPNIVFEVQRLLNEGKLSQRQIARLMNVSRGSVGAIASGKRPDYETSRQPLDDEWEAAAGPPERCPGCGGKVYMPCLLCRARKTSMENPRPTSRSRAVAFEVPSQLTLRPEHYARYEEVRAWRREQVNMPSLPNNGEIRQ